MRGERGRHRDRPGADEVRALAAQRAGAFEDLRQGVEEPPPGGDHAELLGHRREVVRPPAPGSTPAVVSSAARRAPASVSRVLSALSRTRTPRPRRASGGGAGDEGLRDAGGEDRAQGGEPVGGLDGAHAGVGHGAGAHRVGHDSDAAPSSPS
ncbi:hypothetical protein GCM10020254_76280 [Streptomyces goshikiensis]